MAKNKVLQMPDPSDRPGAAVYSWKPGAHIPVKADVAAAEIQRLAKENGSITPESLVEASRKDDAPLHPAFEWDDGEAAQRYRVIQAEKINRSLVVVYRKPDGEMTNQTRALVRLQPRADDPALDEGTEEVLTPRTYVPVQRVMDSAELRRRYRDQAFRELVSWRNRYRDIDEFIRIFEVIDAAAKEFKAG